MKNVAFIPIRKGSKGIPGKNTKIFCGKPLFEWVVRSACAVKQIDSVVIATDEPEVVVYAQILYPKVRVYTRLAENATDTATTESVMLEYFKQTNLSGNDRILLLQATNPFTTPGHIRGAMIACENYGCDTLASVVEWDRLFWDERGPKYPTKRRPRRQEMCYNYMENGAIYITSMLYLTTFECRLANTNNCKYIMPKHTFLELDDEDDWWMGEALMKRFPYAWEERES